MRYHEWDSGSQFPPWDQAAEQAMEAYKLTDSSQIPQDCLCRESYGIHNERLLMTNYLEQEKTVTGVYYAELSRNCAVLKEKRTEKVASWYAASSGQCIGHTCTIATAAITSGDSKCCITHYILQIWLCLISIYVHIFQRLTHRGWHLTVMKISSMSLTTGLNNCEEIIIMYSVKTIKHCWENLHCTWWRLL